MSRQRLIWFVRRRPIKQISAPLRGNHALDAPTGDRRMRRRAGFADAAAVAGASGGLSQPNHQDDRALSGRRHHRLSRPPGRRSADHRPWRDGYCREQARSRHHARRRTGSESRARWLHAVDGDFDHARHQQDAVQESALRSSEGFYPDSAGGRGAVRADHQSVVARQGRCPNSSPMPNRIRDWPMARPATAVRSILARKC